METRNIKDDTTSTEFLRLFEASQFVKSRWIPANQEEVMSSSMEKQTVALSGSAGNQWNEMDWKTQTNEFYIIKGRQKFVGKRFSLSGVSNQLNQDYFKGQFMVFLKVITKPALKDRPLFSLRANTPFGGYRNNYSRLFNVRWL